MSNGTENKKFYLVVSNFKITIKRESYGRVLLNVDKLELLSASQKIVNRIFLEGEKHKCLVR